MAQLTHPADISRPSYRWTPFVAIAIVTAGLLAIGQTQLGAVSDGNKANLETTRQFISYLNGDHDLDAVELITDDAAIHAPDGNFEGPIGAGKFVAEFRAVFPTASFTIRRLEVASNTVTVRWSMTGIHYREYQGLSPMCAGVALDGVTVMRFEDQLIDEQWTHYDRLALIRQIESFNQIDTDLRPGCRNR